MKKTIILFGNCQAQLMAACLNSSPSFCDQYEVIWERNVDLPGWPPKKELSQLQIENCAYLFEQLGRKTIEFPHKDSLPSDCLIVRYPYLKLICLWPLLDLNDPRNKPELPQYDAGRFPYGDKIVIDRLGKNISKEKIFDEYMDLNIKDHVDLDQLFQSDLERIREVDDKCDVKIYRLINEQFRLRKFFSTFCHPSDNTMKILLLKLLDKAGLVKSNGDNSQTLISEIDRYFSLPIFDTVQVPIHPQICDHFGLTWADGTTRYQYYDYGHLTFEEYIQIYIDFEDPEVEARNKIRRLVESDNFEEANEALKQAMTKHPNSSTVLNLKGEMILKTGELQEAKKIFFDIKNRDPNNLEASNNLAVCMIYENDWDSAVDLLLQILKKDPSNTTAKENLEYIKNELSVIEARELIQNGSLSEAKRLIENVLRNDDKHIEALNDLAAIYTQEGIFEEAEKKLHSVFQLEPSNETARHHLEVLTQRVVEYISKNEKYNSEKKIISVHIPKCGGNSFLHFLKNIYGDDLFLDYHLQWILENDTSLIMQKNTRCIHGHFLANKYDSVFPESCLVTWVRHPVQRVASHYFFILRNRQLLTNDPVSSLVYENNLLLAEFAGIKEMRNGMTCFLGSKTLVDFDFVGIIEFYKESLEQFCEMMGMSCPSEIPYENVNKERKKAQYDISQKEFDKISELNSLDVALYQTALANFHLRKNKMRTT